MDPFRRLRLGDQMIRLAEELMKRDYFDHLHKLARILGKSSGKEYVELTLVARRVVKRDFLAMGFSLHKMNLDRYVVFAELRDRVPGSAEEFYEKLLPSLPYPVWMRYAGIHHTPEGAPEMVINYTVPAGSPAEKLLAELENHSALAGGKIKIYRLNYTYYTKPVSLEGFMDKGLMLPMNRKARQVWEVLERKYPPDKREAWGRRNDPHDINDVVIMSYLEAKYTITPSWLSRGGWLKIGARRARHHFKRHVALRYLPQVYVKRPTNPEHIHMTLTAVIKGPDAHALAYGLSRTPYASAMCDYEETCMVHLYVSEDDMDVVRNILDSYRVSVEHQASADRSSPKGIFHQKRTLPFEAYSRRQERWYDLDEAMKVYRLLVARITGRYMKKERIPDDRITK